MTSTDESFLINPDRLAAKPTVFEGTFKPADLERLEDSVANGEGELRYRITAGLDKQRQKVVSSFFSSGFRVSEYSDKPLAMPNSQVTWLRLRDLFAKKETSPSFRFEQ